MDVIYPADRSLTARLGALGRWRTWLGGGAVLILLVAGLLWYQQQMITVTVMVDGRSRSFHTLERDPGRLLARHGYQLRPHDRLSAPGTLHDGARIILHPARPVRIMADGRTRQVWTQAKNVGDVLREAGLVWGWQDEVWLGELPATPATPLPPRQVAPPPAGRPALPWAGDERAVEMTVRRAVPISIIDGKGIPATLYTTAPTIGEALARADVPIYLGDTLFPALGARVQPGQRVVIRRSLPVEITVAGETYVTRTQQHTVGDALAEQGISVFGLDRVEPPLTTPLRPYTHVRIVRVQESIVYEDEYLPFEAVWVPDDALPIDQRRVKQAGATGIKRLRYRVRSEDGVEVSRTLEDDWLAVEPATKIIAYGRKITPQTLETPAGAIRYWRKIRMFATSYSPGTAGVDPSRPWYGRTRLGLPMRKGIVAVDPTVINLRQEVYVPTYGKGLAADTGSAIKGKHIDLGYDDHNLRLWRQWVEVYLLWPPPPDYQIRYVLPNWPPEP
ncbi:MAG: DUF348 domain-containing protein [Chloroflexi bacterium]|nr:DUF348 domain-containing protein [Chloroflexota bacterium]